MDQLGTAESSGTAVECNARYRRLLAGGATGLTVVFDLPTRLGHDSDTPLAHGEVGRAGVAVDSVDDMRVLFAGIPLDRVPTSMTIGARTAALLLLYQVVAEEQGVTADRLTGTTYVLASRPPSRPAGDLLAYCRAELPRRAAVPALPTPAGRRSPPADPVAATRQAERLAKLRAWRCDERVAALLAAVRLAAEGQDNVLYPMKEALAAGATIGEVSAALRGTPTTAQAPF